MNYLVSFPRSGHHWLADLLTIATDGAVKHVDPYKERTFDDDTLQKNHGELDPAAVKEGEKVVVLARDPFRCVVSRFEQMVREGDEKAASYVTLCLQYANFVQRWISRPLAGVYSFPVKIVCYEDLLMHTGGTLEEVIEFFGYDTTAVGISEAIGTLPPKTIRRSFTQSPIETSFGCVSEPQPKG